MKSKKQQRQQAQRRLFDFLRSHKKELNNIESYKKTMRKKTIDAKKFRIHIVMEDEYSKEFLFLKELLYYYDFRQLFGKVFYGLPYKLPDIQNNKVEKKMPITQKNDAKETTVHANDTAVKDIKTQIDPVQYITETLDKEEKVTFRVIDEFIIDLRRILKKAISFEESKFDWRNKTVDDFPTIARDDDDFKAALIRFESGFPMAYRTKV